MNKLPLELYDRIVHFVGRRIGEESLPPWQHGALPFALPTIAAVSRNFQQAVERLTFRNLKITTSPSDLDVFRRVLTPQRQRNLQRLTVQLWIDNLLLRTPSDRRFATGEERRIINERATVHLRELFDILAAWRLPGPSLALEVTSPPLNDKIRAQIRYAYSSEDYLRFTMVDVLGDLADFPPLPMVKELYVYSLSDHLHPHLAVSLTAKMPNVSRVEWDLTTCDNTGDWGLYHYMSRIWRDGLVQSIESTALPPSVEKFSFTMYVPETRFQILPDFIGSTSSPDPVSLALRKLTKDCAEVYIDGSIHTSLFDPLAATGIAPHEASLAWEKVTRLEVTTSIYSPDGKWLFKRDPSDDGTPESPHPDLDVNHLPPGYGSTKSELDEAEEYYEEHHMDITPTDEDGEFYSRTEVNDGPMNALLAAFARGCGRGSAPVLRTATLKSEFFNDENWPFQVTCFAAGEAAPLGWDAEFAGGDHGAWRVFFHVEDWRPAEETLEEFRRIGRERDGCDTVVCFLPWGNFLE